MEKQTQIWIIKQKLTKKLTQKKKKRKKKYPLHELMRSWLWWEVKGCWLGVRGEGSLVGWKTKGHQKRCDGANGGAASSIGGDD